MVPPHLQLRMVVRGAGTCCASVLAELPAWFGIPEANADYVEMAERNPTVVASIEAETVGILTVDHHFDTAAEIHVMAVVPDLHRRGIGVALLEHAERRLIDQGVAYLQVKTLADTHPDAGYVKTRAVIVLPDDSGHFPADTQVECGGVWFTLGDLADLTPLDEVDPGLHTVLEGWLSGFEGESWPQDDWSLLYDDGEIATFAHIEDER